MLGGSLQYLNMGAKGICPRSYNKFVTEPGINSRFLKIYAFLNSFNSYIFLILQISVFSDFFPLHIHYSNCFSPRSISPCFPMVNLIIFAHCSASLYPSLLILCPQQNLQCLLAHFIHLLAMATPFSKDTISPFLTYILDKLQAAAITIACELTPTAIYVTPFLYKWYPYIPTLVKRINPPDCSQARQIIAFTIVTLLVILGPPPYSLNLAIDSLIHQYF